MMINYLNAMNAKTKKLFAFIQNSKRIKLTLIFSFLCLMFIFFAYVIGCKIENKSNPSVVIVSTKRIVSDFTKSLSQNTHLSDDQKIMLVKQFDTIYPGLIKDYANHNNVLIIDDGLAIQTPNSIKNITVLIEKQIQIMTLSTLKRNKP